MPCPQCQHPTNDMAKFCEECGTRLVHVCPHCRHEVSPRAKFCEDCATPLAGYVSSSSSALPTRRGTEDERRFQALLLGVMGLLQREKRVPYRTLKYVFGIDETVLEEIREDLRFRRFAIDEDGQGLVWTDETHPTVQLVTTIPSQSATADVPAVTSPAAPALPPPVTGINTPSNRPTALPEPVSSDAQQEEPASTPEPPRSAPEAERRHLTVMFCDLAALGAGRRRFGGGAGPVVCVG